MGRKTGPFHSRSAPDLSERRPSRARKPFGKSVRWREARGEEVGGEKNDDNKKKKKRIFCLRGEEESLKCHAQPAKEEEKVSEGKWGLLVSRHGEEQRARKRECM